MSRSIDALYCDDVRHETGGKVSFMGIYGNALLVPEFGIVLPKLCVCVRIHTPVDDPFDQVELIITRDDTPLFEADISPDPNTVDAILQNIPDTHSDEPQGWLSMLPIVLLSPFEIPGPGKLRTRIRTASGDLHAPALQIGLAPRPG